MALHPPLVFAKIRYTAPLGISFTVLQIRKEKKAGCLWSFRWCGCLFATQGVPLSPGFNILEIASFYYRIITSLAGRAAMFWPAI
jgi:hypothetical protein